MKPSPLRIERLLAKVEAELARSARPRRYCFHFDEVAEAEAQGLPYVLAPRVLSHEEWIEQYSGDKGPGETIRCRREDLRNSKDGVHVDDEHGRSRLR
jgi:hypothetical protein